MNILNFEMNVLELLLLVIGQWSDEVVHAWNQDFALGRDELGHCMSQLCEKSPALRKVEHTQDDQVGHRLMNRSAESARVQVTVRSRNLDLVVVYTSETISQVGRLGVQPVVVYLSERRV